MGVNYNLCHCQNENHNLEREEKTMNINNISRNFKNIPKKDFAFNSTSKVNLNEIKRKASVDKIIKAYRNYKNKKDPESKYKRIEINGSLITFNKNENNYNSKIQKSNNKNGVFYSNNINSTSTKMNLFSSNKYNSNIINNENIEKNNIENNNTESSKSSNLKMNKNMIISNNNLSIIYKGVIYF